MQYQKNPFYTPLHTFILFIKHGMKNFMHIEVCTQTRFFACKCYDSHSRILSKQLDYKKFKIITPKQFDLQHSSDQLGLFVWHKFYDTGPSKGSLIWYDHFDEQKSCEAMQVWSGDMFRKLDAKWCISWAVLYVFIASILWNYYVIFSD